MDDLAELRRETNDGRLEALSALLDRHGLAYEMQRFPNLRPDHSPRRQGTNLIVTLGTGTTDLVIGAHYDAAPLAEGGITDGMIDNGAGSIVLTRIAKALEGRQLRHRMRVVFFDMEELGLLGSRHFVEREVSSPIAAMVNVDIAAAGDTVIYGPSTDRSSARLFDALQGACAMHAFDCLLFPAYPPGDDVSFRKNGIPTVSIEILPALEAHQLWLRLNGGEASGLQDGFAPWTASAIHTAADVLDAVDPAAMTRLYRLTLDTLLGLDAALP